MCLCYYIAWPCDLDLWSFDLESVSCTVLLMSDPHTNLHYPTIIGDLYCVEWGVKLYSLTDWFMNYWIWSHFRYQAQSSRMRRVTWPIIGGKNSPHFWNPWPQFAYSLCHFHGATTKIKPCYWRKRRLFHCEGYKVHCACAVSRDLCIGGPPKPHLTIFWPRIVYSLCNFYGATTTVKGSFILEHPHVKAIFDLKNCPVKIGPQNGGFSEI